MVNVLNSGRSDSVFPGDEQNDPTALFRTEHGRMNGGRLPNTRPPLIRLLPILCMLPLLLLFSCAPKRPVAPSPVSMAPGKDILAEADRRQAAGLRLEALALYEKYLKRFEDGEMADEALFKAGKIRQGLGALEDARKDFLLLVREHPESPYAAEALLALMAISYHQGAYGDVIQYASQIMRRPVSSEQIFNIYSLLGDTHLAMGAGKDAVIFYAMAGRQAGPGQTDLIRARIKQAIRQLPTTDIQALLDRIDDPLAEGYLLYQLGLNETEADNFEAATDALNRFIERFPDHEYAADAEALVAEIESSYTYRSNVIGCLLPLTGPYKLYGNRALKGIELALNRVIRDPNAPRWELLIRDTGSDPDRSVSAVREFFTQKVAAVIGPIITAKEASAEAQALGIPIIILSQKEGIPATGSFVFRNFMTPQMQVQNLLSYLVRERHMGRFGVFFPEEPYGRTFMNDFWDQAVELGADVVAVHPYDGQKTDFADSIRSLVGVTLSEQDRPLRSYRSESAASGPEGRFLEEVLLGVENRREPAEASGAEPPAFEDLLDPAPIVDFDALFIPDSAPKVAMIVPQLAYYDVTDLVLLGTNLWHSQSLLEKTGQYMQGALIPTGYFSGNTSQPVAEFTADYRSAYGEDPGFIEAVAHDTAMILFDVVGRSGSKFRSGIRDELLTVQNYPAVTGPTSFDRDGEARKRLYLIQIKGRKFREVARGDAPTR